MMCKANIDIEMIHSKYRDGEYDIDYSKYDTDRWHSSKVIDEDKSVKWNKQQVEEHNSRIIEEYKRRDKDKRDMDERLRADCIQAIKHTFRLSDVEAMKVYNFCYDRWHSNMEEFFENIWDIGKLIEDIKH